METIQSKLPPKLNFKASRCVIRPLEVSRTIEEESAEWWSILSAFSENLIFLWGCVNVWIRGNGVEVLWKAK